MHRLSTAGVPILSWADVVDDATLEQAQHLAELPFAFHHIALMPDAHVGYGMPIGGVFAALGQVVPHAVGLDIGCGVRAWCANVPAAEALAVRDLVFSDVMRSIPSGHEWHGAAQNDETGLFDSVPDSAALRAELDKARKQVGSLGGGNHFIELQQDERGTAWVMVHSGSRNVGKQMAEYYDGVARRENASGGSSVPPEWGLAHLALGSQAGAEYLAVMNWCLDFAKESRRRMSEAVRRALTRRIPEVSPSDEIDIHHNYASVETHFGQEVVIHRKGAVHATGTVLVPGSMGTASYIGRGLANPDAFESCAHGAGRAMGRKAALKAYTVEQVRHELDEAGVKLFKQKKKDIPEEAPRAYKDIVEVMSAQRDLVEPITRLMPVAVYKG